MSLLKEKLIVVWKRLLEAYADYRVTVSAVALLAIYEAINNFFYIFEYETLGNLLIVRWFFDYTEEISTGLLLFICGSLFVESFLPYTHTEKRAKTARLVCFLLAAVIAVTFSFCIYAMPAGEAWRNFPLSDSTLSMWAEQYAWGYALLLLLGTVYFCHRKSGIGFAEYMLHVLANFCVTTAVYIVLSIGVVLVLSVADILFFDGILGNFTTTGTILVTGLYYVPGCITALRNMDSEIDNSPVKYLLRDMITSLTIFAMMIVYAYLIKILLLWEMPSNEIFGTVTGLFCFGMPIWVMDCYYWDDSRYMRIVQRLPYGLIPLIPLQIYAMGVRIYEYGMTPSRYLGTGMVVVEIAVLVIWYYWKDNMERVLLVLGVCVAIAFLAPGINMNSLSDRWQGAIEERLAKAGTDMETDTKVESHRIHCCQMVGSLDVEGYASFAMLNQNLRYEGAKESRIPVDFSAFRFYERETGTAVIADISDFANRCMDYEKEHPDADKEEFSTAMKPYQKIVLEDDRVLYMNHFEIRYEDGIKDGEDYFEIESVNISGMLLEKGEGGRNTFGLPLMDATVLLVTENKGQEHFEEYEYDKKGRMLRYMEGIAQSFDSTEYWYDEAGNCMKKTRYEVHRKKEDPEVVVQNQKEWSDYSYGEDEAGQPVQTEWEYYAGGSLRSICERDSEGERLKETTYRKSGQLWSERVYDVSKHQLWLTEYDEKEQVERQYRTDYDEQGSVILNATYDGEGNEIGDEGDCDCGPDGFDFWGRRFEYEYDNDGNLIRQTGFDEQGNRTGYIEKSYDAHGNLISEAVYDGEDTQMYYEKNAYDEKDHLIFHYYVHRKESGYDSEGLGRKEGYEYDEAGRCIRKWVRSCDEGEDEEIPPEDSVYVQWERTYDEQGRLVRYTNGSDKYVYTYTAVGDLDGDYPYERIKLR